MKPRRRMDPYWMLAPTALLLLLFFFYPLVYGFVRSLYAWDLLTPPRYVGLKHYRWMVESGELLNMLTTTLLFSVVVVAGSTGAGLILALALSRPGRFVAFVRGSVFSAYVVSWVSVALLWLWVLDSDAGILSHILQSVGLPHADWLGDPDFAPLTLAFVTAWKITGYALVLFVAGLQDIPRDLHEAAALDGAGRWHRFANVTWPLLRPTAAFVQITALILSFQVFDVVRVMTQGGPGNATTVFVYAIYEQIFQNLRVGRASAEVVVFFAILMLLTGFQIWAWRRRGAI